MITFDLRFVVDQAVLAGVLPRHRRQDGECPDAEISLRDTPAIATALASLTKALGDAESLAWIRKETAARIFAHMASQLGAEIDASEECRRRVSRRDAMQDYQNQEPQRAPAARSAIVIATHARSPRCRRTASPSGSRRSPRASIAYPTPR